MKLALIIVALLVAGCTAPTGIRKVTAWGVWMAPFGQPIGVGYWHSEHGEGVKSDDETPSPIDALP